MTFVPSQDAIVRAQAAASAFCPLRPNACPGSERPFSLEALRAWVEHGKQVLAAHDTAPAFAVRGGMVAWGPTGAELRALRGAAGLTLRAVSAAAGISRSSLQGIETGDRVGPAVTRQRLQTVIDTLVRTHTPRPCLLCPNPLPIGAPTRRRYCSDRCYEDAHNTQHREQYVKSRRIEQAS